MGGDTTTEKAVLSAAGHVPTATASAITKLQAIFRGHRCRDLHVERVRRGLPWSPFVPARVEAVDAMIRVAQLQENETLVDIGSGDGRVLLAAVNAVPMLKQAIGIEIDSALVGESRRKIQMAGLSERVRVVHSDWLDVDLSDADAVILFFLPHDDLAATLQSKLRPGTRVVTYVFQIPQWVPDLVESTVPFMTEKGTSFIYRYRVPDRVRAA